VPFTTSCQHVNSFGEWLMPSLHCQTLNQFPPCGAVFVVMPLLVGRR
jgi:hypothetical protein